MSPRRIQGGPGDPWPNGTDKRARSRALNELAHRHAKEFQKIYDAEREAEGLPPVQVGGRAPVSTARLVKDYLAGMTLKEVGAKHDVHWRTVANRLDEARVPRRRRGRRTEAS